MLPICRLEEYQSLFRPLVVLEVLEVLRLVELLELPGIIHSLGRLYWPEAVAAAVVGLRLQVVAVVAEADRLEPELHRPEQTPETVGLRVPEIQL